MSTTLVIITFIAGNAFGPVVTVSEMKNTPICLSLVTSSSLKIQKMAATNISGRAVITQDGPDTVVSTPSGREMVRLSCLKE